jgi:hypothetical protein
VNKHGNELSGDNFLDVLSHNSFSNWTQIWYLQNASQTLCLPPHFRAGFLLGSFFDPEDEGEMFLRNVG